MTDKIKKSGNNIYITVYIIGCFILSLAFLVCHNIIKIRKSIKQNKIETNDNDIKN